MIGLFDSGIGGLSVLREIEKLLPSEDFVFFGDNAHVPYGEKSAEEIIAFSRAAVQFLLTFQPSLIVVACNTATSVAITTIRAEFPNVPIVGVVPVVKTLSQETKNKRAAVCATKATLSSVTYQKLKHDFAPDIQFLELALPEWVMFVERGAVNGSAAISSVAEVAKKITDFGADVVALGSTHFPFLRPVIEPAIPHVRIFDSGPAVARQVVRIMTKNHQLPSFGKIGSLKIFCSGNPENFGDVASALLHRGVIASPYRQKR